MAVSDVVYTFIQPDNLSSEDISDNDTDDETVEQDFCPLCKFPYGTEPIPGVLCNSQPMPCCSMLVCSVCIHWVDRYNRCHTIVGEAPKILPEGLPRVCLILSNKEGNSYACM